MRRVLEQRNFVASSSHLQSKCWQVTRCPVGTGMTVILIHSECCSVIVEALSLSNQLCETVGSQQAFLFELCAGRSGNTQKEAVKEGRVSTVLPC